MVAETDDGHRGTVPRCVAPRVPSNSTSLNVAQSVSRGQFLACHAPGRRVGCTNADSDRADREHPAAGLADRGDGGGGSGSDQRRAARGAVRGGRARDDRSSSRRPVAGRSPTGSSGSRALSPTRSTASEGLAPDGVVIPFEDGHTRQLPRLTRGPFRYQTYADEYLAEAQRSATRPLKQAVISASAISLLYPPEGIDGYPREEFLADLVNEAETRHQALARGWRVLRPGRLHRGEALLEARPSGGLLRRLRRAQQPGAAALLGRGAPAARRPHLPGRRPRLDPQRRRRLCRSCCRRCSSSRPGSFYIQLASEPDRRRVLG